MPSTIRTTWTPTYLSAPPFQTELYDPHPFRYIFNEPALSTIGLDKVKDAFVKYCSDKNLQAEVTELYMQEYPSEAVDGEEAARKTLLKNLFDNYFSKMSYVDYKSWVPLIPQKDEMDAQIWLEFIMADAGSSYEDEEEWEYWRRKKDVADEPDYTDDIDFDYDFEEAPLRRAARLPERYDPFHVQSFIELGVTATVYDWVKDILTAEEKEYIDPTLKDKDFGVTYDGGAFNNSFLEGMKTSKCHILFVYGMQDPWTGARIADENLGENSKILMIENGTHNDYFDYWSKSELSTLTHWLAELGFLDK